MKKTLFIFLFLMGIFHYGIGNNSTDKLMEKKEKQRDWTILATYDIPESASGLAWDGTYLYCGIYGSNGDRIYRIDPSDGSYQLQCNGPHDDAYGLTYDGTNLWTIIQPSGPSNPSLATEFSLNGAFVSDFTLPDHYMSGIAYDNGDFWVATYYDPDGHIYKVDDQGNILDEFAAPDNQPWDLTVEDEYLWMADYWGDALYKIEKASGTMIESHPSENVDPAGIVWDGEFLWYCDAGGSGDHDVLYKVDLYGAGTPEINVPVRFHDYGILTIGDSDIWNCEVQNTGEVDLIINEVDIPDTVAVTTTFTTPHTIPPGQSVHIPFQYQPDEFAELNTTVMIRSNDPINPEIGVSLAGHGVYAGPSAFFFSDNHDYGEVRMNAYTRWFLEIQNQGDEELSITNIEFDDDHFTLDYNTQLPLDVSTLDIDSIGVWFSPSYGGDFSCNMTITHNDETNNPFTVSLEGTGLKKNWPIGDALWWYFIEDLYDSSPKAILAYDDMTGDGVDEVIVCSEDNYIRCLNGNSSGLADMMWQREIYSGSVFRQDALQEIEDINNDGVNDIIVGTAWGDRSVVALSGNSGKIIWKYQTNEYGDGGWIYQVECKYDYNGDGFTDVLAASGNDGSGTGPRRVFCINGETGEVIWDAMLGGAVFCVIGVEDFTGDDLPDVIAGSTEGDSQEGKATGINGSNGGQEWNFYTAGPDVWALAELDDINGDNINDCAIGDFSGNIYFLDAVDGNQLYQNAIYGEIILRFEVLDDVNDDGYSDVFIAHSGTNGVMINGYDASTIWNKSLPDKSYNVAWIADVSGDKINDALVGTLYSNNYCIFIDGVNGNEIKSINYNTPVDAINSIPDIVGDNSMEMVTGGRNGNVYCYSGGPLEYVNIPHTVRENNLPYIFPNPFRDELTLAFTLEKQSRVVINCYDINGTRIHQLTDEMLTEGSYEYQWHGKLNKGTKIKTGIYFIELIIGDKPYREQVIRIK